MNYKYINYINILFLFNYWNYAYASGDCETQSDGSSTSVGSVGAPINPFMPALNKIFDKCSEKHFDSDKICETAGIQNSKKEKEAVETAFNHIGPRISHYYSNKSEIESLKAGARMYLKSRNERRLIFDNWGNLSGLFNKKEGIRTLRIDRVAPEDENFFKKYKDQPSPPLSGSTTDIDAVVTGNTGAVRRVLREGDSKVIYFKRSQEAENPAQIGKGMAAEKAAYLLSELLELEIVPKTTIVTFKGQVGTAQESVPADFLQLASFPNNGKNLLNQTSFSASFSDMELFNYLGSIRDRHSGNLFINPKTFQIKSIDHSGGFHFVLPLPLKNLNKNFIVTGGLPKTYSDRSRVKLAQLTYDKLKTHFKSDLTRDQIRALWLRIEIVKADIISKYHQLLPASPALGPDPQKDEKIQPDHF